MSISIWSMFKMRLSLSSLILVLGFFNVNSLPENSHPMKRDELLRLAGNDFPKFKTIIESQNPRNHGLPALDFFRLGNSLFRRQQFEDALWYYTEAYNKSRRPMYLIKMGLCHLENQDYDTAITLLKQAVSMDLSGTAQNNLISVLFRSGKFDGTVKDALCLLSHTNLLLLGDWYAKVNKLDEALHCYNEGLKKSSQKEDLFLARALCYFKMGRVDEARSDLANATKNPKINFWIYHHFIKSMFIAGKFDEGVREGTRNLDEDYLNQLAIIFFIEEKFEYAIRICDEALARDNVFTLPFYWWRGKSHVRLGHENAAIEDFRAAYNALQSETTNPRMKRKILGRLPPERPEILYHLIETLLSIGESEEALLEIHKLDEADFAYVVTKFLSKKKLGEARLVSDHGIKRFPSSKELKKLQENCETMRMNDSKKRRKSESNPPVQQSSDATT